MSRADRGVFLVPQEGRYILISRGQFVGWTTASTPKFRMDRLRAAEKRLGWFESQGNEAAQNTLREMNDRAVSARRAREEIRRRDRS